MKEIFFTSGSTGNKKSILFDELDLYGLTECASDFIYVFGGEPGNIYNFFPHNNNLGYYLVRNYADITDSTHINLGLCQPQVAKEIFKKYPPTYIAGVGQHLLPLLTELKDDIVGCKHIIVAKGIIPYRSSLEKILPKGCQLHATYGATELKKAWTTCKSLDCGYHVFGGGFTVDNGELIYCGIRTHDKGILYDGVCPSCGCTTQRIGLEVQRMNTNQTNTKICGINI